MRANSARIKASEINVTVTSLDAESQLVKMYPNSRAILDELRSSGINIRHGVDATKLESLSFKNDTQRNKFDRVVFNFPHYVANGGGNKNISNKIHRHRQLLVAFFASASQVLTRDGQIWVTLCAGQGGTKLEMKPRTEGNTWQIIQCAAAAKLVLQDAHFFPMEALTALGYYSVGYQSREKAFWTEGGITHVFCHEARGHKSCFPITWRRGISFWITDEALFTQDRLVDVLHEHFPLETMDLAISLLDEYRCKNSGRKSVTYRLDISSPVMALSRERINALVQTALYAIDSSEFGACRTT